MGLDAYIFSRSNDIPEQQQKYYDNRIELAYFRKFHDLHRFFYDHHNRHSIVAMTEYDYNGVETQIDHAVLVQLKALAADVEYEWSSDLTQHGVATLNVVIAVIEQHLNDGMHVYYNSWW